MPRFNYQCSKCFKFFETTAKFTEQRILSECCKHIAIRRAYDKIPAAPVEIREEIDQEEGPIDGGIPFGTVPGDEDYTGETGGKKIGEEGYIGPLP